MIEKYNLDQEFVTQDTINTLKFLEEKAPDEISNYLEIIRSLQKSSEELNTKDLSFFMNNLES